MRAADIPARVLWAAELLAPRPRERLLEIGCGNGVAAQLLCATLSDGDMLAIDRSATAVSRTTRRCAGFVADGRLRVEQSDLSALRVDTASFDAALAINVNVFWTSSAEDELAVLRGALRPKGRLVLVYGQGPGSVDDRQAKISQHLRDAHFTVTATYRRTPAMR
ncbi:class I SAM-dependent methyltransferase [Williamsia sp. D3]|uniref:class I SAM-dependent methyltransferase n=1 Tax=Williamsia sp. D3 TaxID=1313067 RepID=UPI0003D2B41A|nr:class I SAM-dependent methyltransferase [Williamsia sp. D3]ETD32656.1 hypothetical protein W823_12300 [Williamsia sp. D3]